MELFRAALFHTPGNPFLHPAALEHQADGGLLTQEGRIAACGDYSQIRADYPHAITIDMRGGYLLPGFIDTHTHFPQLRIIGRLGQSLLAWLRSSALPEEARMADLAYARPIAKSFLHSLASHGTTTALVFASHFPESTAALFLAAADSGLRIISGLVLSDRGLIPPLHRSPARAHSDSAALIRQFHSRGRLLYSVTPRFALSCSEAILEVCQSLLSEHPSLRFQTHINENLDEVEQTRAAFPWAEDYLSVYERYDLVSRRSVLAHNIHPSPPELNRIAAHGASVAHCPCSNAALGSGIFPMRCHIDAGVRFALGTDIGAGAGFSLLKEALQAYLMQRVAPTAMTLEPAHLLYLATRAGAEALGLDAEIGDFQPGKSADLIYLRPPDDSPLAEVIRRAERPEHILAALFTLAGAETIREVRVAGAPVYSRPRGC